MRVFRLILLLFTLLMPAAHAQDDSMRGPNDRPPLGEPIRFPRGETEIRIHDPKKLPPQLRDALKKAFCKPEFWMKDIPVHIFRLKAERARPLVAVVPCDGISLRSRAYMFDRQWMPIPLSFPVIEPPSGIGATFAPGYLQWDAATKTMTAIATTDVCPSRQTRYTYRAEGFDPNETASWILLKAEQSPKECSGQLSKEWQVFWEAPEWRPL